jgi:hypothetical protein
VLGCRWSTRRVSLIARSRYPIPIRYTGIDLVQIETAPIETVPVTDEQLRREAAFLHAALFDRPPLPAIVERYIAAHRTLLSHADAVQQAVVDRVVDLKLDPVAVEFALRFRAPGHLASTKLRVLVYLAEASEGYFGTFVNAESDRLHAWRALLLAMPRAAYLLAKGVLLVRRHRLA